MAYKRILCIQDISCVGQCSMTVALPILSVCGHETCLLPTAVLSTHTGGFGKPEIVHLDNYLIPMTKHWQENNIVFDCILVGYLGSSAAVEAVDAMVDTMLSPGGYLIVDPAMADHGKRYSGLTEEYAKKMEHLCRRAHIMLPNITEAAMFAGVEYRDEIDECYVRLILEKLNHPCVVLTGIGYEKHQTGAAIWDGKIQYIFHDRVDQRFHGTGDMFAACFTGALLQGHTLERAAEIAGNFVYESIQNTVQAPVHWYGVKFETALPGLIHALQEKNGG